MLNLLGWSGYGPGRPPKHEDPANHDLECSDCSGLGVESFALKALGISSKHAWASDKCADAHRFLKTHCCPQMLFKDMFNCDQKISTLPTPSIYWCGFPCQPWSIIRNKSRKWKEASARPFWKTIGRICALSPPIAVLENVLGSLGQWARVCGVFRRGLPQYQVLGVTFCSSQVISPCLLKTRM